jgi:16S rRNA C1402 N4-methylase RsmH
MAGLFGRIFRQWAEEAVVNRLAESKHFQRAAVSAVKTAESAQSAIEEGMRDPTKVKETATSFFSALKAEITKDLDKWNETTGAPPNSNSSVGGGGGKRELK